MKIIYKTILFLFVLLFSSDLIAQSLQTYSGDYDLSGSYFWVKGQATYTYKELADYTKVREGSFQFKSDMKGEEFGQSYRARFTESVSGQYKNNAKIGLWQHNMQLLKIEDTNASIDVRANYKNGKPHGNWTMDLKDLTTGETKETMSMNFNNGTITGEFKKINIDNGRVITGTCDENGYLHGKVVTKEFDEEMIREFSHGIMQLYVLRDAKTGEVKERKTADKETLDMMVKLQNLAKTNPAELENIPFKLVEEVAEFNTIYVKSVLDIMQFKDFPGDSLFSDRNDEYYWKGFKVLDIEKQETKAQKEARLAEEAAKKAAEEKALAEKKAAMEKARAEEEAARIREESLSAELGKQDKIYNEKAQSVAKEMQKKRILAAYTLVNEAYKAKYEATNDKAQKIELLKKQILLCDKVLSLVAVKTNDLENQLKVATKAEEVEKILGL